jgi:hypothetical protein
MAHVDVLHRNLLPSILPELLEGQQSLLIDRHEARGRIDAFDFCVWGTRARGSPKLLQGAFVSDGQLMCQHFSQAVRSLNRSRRIESHRNASIHSARRDWTGVLVSTVLSERVLSIRTMFGPCT